MCKFYICGIIFQLLITYPVFVCPPGRPGCHCPHLRRGRVHRLGSLDHMVVDTVDTGQWPRSLFLSLSVCLSLYISLSLSLSLSLFFSLYLFISLSLSHTHTHAHTLSLSGSPLSFRSQSLSLALGWGRGGFYIDTRIKW